MRARLLLPVLLVAGCGRSHFDLDASDATADGAGITNNIAFVTSTTQLPLMYGSDFSGADALCNARAAAAALPGTYVALLSKGGVKARDRLGAARGWVRVDGKPFLDQVGDISTAILHPLEIDENGADVGSTFVHTGTLGTGADSGNDCMDYTDSGGTITIGSTKGTTSYWLAGNTGACTVAQRIYCFGIDRTNPLTITPETGRRTFVTVQSMLPDASGIAQADNLCNSEAGLAGLTGTYKAFLATTGATAISRLTLSGMPWVRLDGIPLVANPLDLGAGKLLTTPNVTSAKTYYGGQVATGGNTPASIAGAGGESCTDWTTNGTSIVGAPNDTTRFFNVGAMALCAKPIYCFED